VDENIMKDKLFYLTFKTSDADTVTKYVYGDIYYAVNKDDKETGSNYRIKDRDAFKQAAESIKDCGNKTILNFRNGFEKHRENIEKMLNYDSIKYNAIFLHFDFRDRDCKYWYNKEELDEIDKLLIHHFLKKKIKNLYQILCFIEQSAQVKRKTISNSRILILKIGIKHVFFISKMLIIYFMLLIIPKSH
jgi:hypothetical protein